jgi:hypothetical protein
MSLQRIGLSESFGLVGNFLNIGFAWASKFCAVGGHCGTI